MATRKEKLPKLTTYTLDNWGVVSTGDWYQAPELQRKILVGTRREDGKSIHTSFIVGADGRTITTYSGSKVTLGEANPEYIQYLKVIGQELDEENPIRMK